MIINGIYNGQNIEALLKNFAERSHLDDVESFATIFEVSNRYGGNLKKVVGDTYRIINEKIEMEIKTLLTANKNELNIMMLMPLIIMVTLSEMGSMSIVQNTLLNILTKAAALVLFGTAYFIGRKIVDIKI